MFVVVYFRKDWSIMEVVSLIQKIKPVFMPLTLGLVLSREKVSGSEIRHVTQFPGHFNILCFSFH